MEVPAIAKVAGPGDAPPTEIIDHNPLRPADAQLHQPRAQRLVLRMRGIGFQRLRVAKLRHKAVRMLWRLRLKIPVRPMLKSGAARQVAAQLV